jgi:hypothetical protein
LTSHEQVEGRVDDAASCDPRPLAPARATSRPGLDVLAQGGQTCAICGASRAAAVPWDAPPPPAPPRRRGLFDRLVDAGAGVVERALTVPPPIQEPPPPDLEAEPVPRGRPRMRVRPFPFGVVVTWESDADDPRRAGRLRDARPSAG